MSKRGKLARESSHSRLVDETLNDITNLRNQYPHTRSRSRMAFEEDLLNSTNEQSSITTNETPNKLKKVQLNQSISDLMVEIEYQKIIDECFVGRFIFPVINTTETRHQYQFRQIDTSHLNDLKLQFINNVIGKNYLGGFWVKGVQSALSEISVFIMKGIQDIRTLLPFTECKNNILLKRCLN